jgi:ABC-type Fe3+-hydroxamate transport system substrate-binding protein
MPFIHAHSVQNFTANRIISLVPSISEYLYDLRLDAEVIGITKFCVHPTHWLKEKTIVGGTKNVNIEKIKRLKPDLIIANKEENIETQIDALAEHYPVLLTDINTYEDALTMLTDIGQITDRKEESNVILEKTVKAFSELNNQNLRRTCMYFIWQDPIMVVGKNTYINDMLEKVGFHNIIQNNRYPEISEAQILALAPDYILLSSEPYPFKEKHLALFQKKFHQSKVKLVDGELFSWYGSRMQLLPPYILSQF